MKKKILLYGTISILLCFCCILTPKASSYTGNANGLKYGDLTWQSQQFVKPDWAENYVKVNTAKTGLTNPCPKCKIGFKLRDTIGDYFTGVVITMNSGKTEIRCSDGCLVPATYEIGLMRSDFTLLKTDVNYTYWY